LNVIPLQTAGHHNMDPLECHSITNSRPPQYGPAWMSFHYKRLLCQQIIFTIL